MPLTVQNAADLSVYPQDDAFEHVTDLEIRRWLRLNVELNPHTEHLSDGNGKVEESQEANV